MNEKILLLAKNSEDETKSRVFHITLTPKLAEMIKATADHMKFMHIRYQTPFHSVTLPFDALVFEGEGMDEAIRKKAWEYFDGMEVQEFPEMNEPPKDIVFPKGSLSLDIDIPDKEYMRGDWAVWLRYCCRNDDGAYSNNAAPVQILSDFLWSTWYGKPSQTKKGKNL